MATPQESGFWRRVRITPGKNAVQAEVEDDYHCMSVIVHHDGCKAVSLEIDMRRAPWTTCPGAVKKLHDTFTNAELAQFGKQGEKQHNCTHLYDMALLAAKHWQDGEQTVYDIQVTDPVDNQRNAKVKKNGRLVLSWLESNFRVIEPESAAGIRLDQLRDWIGGLAGELREPARLLQWGNMLANGRIIPMEQQSDASKMPPSCHTFQPQQAAIAKRVGEIKDFNFKTGMPLGDYEPNF